MTRIPGDWWRDGLRKALGGLVVAAVIATAPAGLAQVWPSPDGPAQGAQSDDDRLATALDAYLAVFYHELGHALIDILQPPVLGLEEDAADILSVVLIHELWEPEDSDAKLRAAAGFWAQSAAALAETGEPAFYGGVHSPDARRYFTYVCLYYGADPEARSDLAVELGLPDDRAESCPDEYALANESWGPYLDVLYDAGPGASLVWAGAPDEEDAFAQMLRDEVDALNAILTLPDTLSVQIALCDEANAFYDPSARSVTLCVELADAMLGEAQDL